MNYSDKYHHNLRELYYLLRHGDITHIARELKVSRVTVYRALTGENDRHNIVDFTLKLLKSRVNTEEDLITFVKRNGRG